jgi:prepilin-type N-terminal cleavage/methylation domain-containing protein
MPSLKRSQSGFTLLELLLAVSVFALVSAFAATTIASSVKLQLQQRHNQSITQQSQQIIDEITSSIQGSEPKLVGGPAIRVARITGGLNAYGPNSLIVTRNLKGDGSGEFELIVYCIESSTIGPKYQRFVRYRFSDSTTNDMNSVGCSGAGTPEYLTDRTTDVLSFRAWLLNTPIPGAPAVVNPRPGVSLEIVSRYSPLVGGGEQRVEDKSANRLVLRTTIFRPDLSTALDTVAP